MNQGKLWCQTAIILEDEIFHELEKKNKRLKILEIKSSNAELAPSFCLCLWFKIYYNFRRQAQFFSKVISPYILFDNI
jgi:hypothetical protein